MYRTLDSDQTIRTLKTLSNRIDERFPDSSLHKVCLELTTMATETRGRIASMSRPHLVIRLCVGLLLVSVIVGCWFGIRHIKAADSEFDVTEFVPMLEAGLNALVLIGAALFFLFTLESRIKRGRALNALHELRAVSHVIDMHQLTKDPSQLLAPPSLRTASSPQRTLTAFQLTRYLDYCSEMLSLIGKLGALYAQSIPDTVVLDAVNDIEVLTNGLSRKIWQKIVILEDDVERESKRQLTTALPDQSDGSSTPAVSTHPVTSDGPKEYT